ncbi:hypothetical protein ABT255_42375 [Streptomyces mirabilis]|uniref:hypothetical protein n=1 Tax=Streptomyces mirabilis TaxID=68239 RepID=UPI0033347D5D
MPIPQPNSAITTANLIPIPSSASSVILFPPAGSGSARVVWNDSTATLYLKFGAVASTTSFTVKLAPGAYYEFPQPLYVGQVDGIWDSANGFARLTSW